MKSSSNIVDLDSSVHPLELFNIFCTNHDTISQQDPSKYTIWTLSVLIYRHRCEDVRMSVWILPFGDLCVVLFLGIGNTPSAERRSQVCAISTLPLRNRRPVSHPSAVTTSAPGPENDLSDHCSVVVHLHNLQDVKLPPPHPVVQTSEPCFNFTPGSPDDEKYQWVLSGCFLETHSVGGWVIRVIMTFSYFYSRYLRLQYSTQHKNSSSYVRECVTRSHPGLHTFDLWIIIVSVKKYVNKLTINQNENVPFCRVWQVRNN